MDNNPVADKKLDRSKSVILRKSPKTIKPPSNDINQYDELFESY